MKKLTIQTRCYILVSIAIGLGMLIVDLTRLSLQDGWLLVMACGLASITQILKIEGATSRSSYNVSWVLFGFTFVLLGAPAAVLVVVVAHLAEWICYKYPWYIQSFNIASYIVSIWCARLVYGLVSALPLSPDAMAACSIVAAMAVFTLVNHLMIGVVIWMARGENFAKSGVFNTLTLMIDASLLCLGTAAALIWVVNTFAVIVTLIPLYLMYSTLRVPALERQTDTDPKTGLYNTRYFNQILEREVARAHRDERPLVVAIADLDLLRNINNTYGHLAGDVVLIGIAKILQKHVRASDVLSRFGGEEFAILMPNCTPEQVASHIESIRMEIQAAEFMVETSVTPIRITMSFGIAGLERPGQTGTEIMHNADVALYHSKFTGRNRVSVYDGQTSDNLLSVVSTVNRQPTPTQGMPTAVERTPAELEPRVEKATAERMAIPGPTIAKRAPWMIKAYIGFAVVAALVLFGIVSRSSFPMDWMGLSLFAIIVMLTELLAVDIYVKDTSVSSATVPLLAGAVLFGPLGALVLSLVLAVTAKIRHGSPIHRLFFNAANHLISSLLVVALFQQAGQVIDINGLLPMMALCVLAAGVVYISSTSLIAIAIDLDSGQSARQVWSERFRWLAPTYLVMGAVSTILVFSHLQFGLIGAIAVVCPLGILIFGQKQYVNRTKSVVGQLHATIATLQKKTREVTALNEDMLQMLSRTLEMRDPYVAGHSKHVARYAVLIAKQMGHTPEQVEIIRQAALLHDIGKLGISETILFKPSSLTPAEYETVKQHPALGARIIEQCRGLRALAPIIRHHHERYDGKGYPDMLVATNIPPESRIIALADTVEAMASDRPYRRGMSIAAIMKEVQAQAGAQFDPQVLEAFSMLIDREGESVIGNQATMEQKHTISRQWVAGASPVTVG